MRTAKAVKDVFFPTRCLVCGSFFHVDQCRNEESSQENRWKTFKILMTPFLCSTCTSEFLPIESPICPTCGIMFKSRQGEDHVCGECLESPKRFEIARSVGIYENALMDAIHCFKYKGKIQLARPFGMLLFASFINCWNANSIDLIVPVPLHNKKLKTRGFNPSFLLVRDWELFAAESSVEMSKIRVVRDVLTKIKWTEPQTGLMRKKRLTNVKNAFSIEDSAKIAGKRILLVDDVYTTGATVNECSNVLLRDGAGHVDVLTLARAM